MRPLTTAAVDAWLRVEELISLLAVSSSEQFSTALDNLSNLLVSHAKQAVLDAYAALHGERSIKYDTTQDEAVLDQLGVLLGMGDWKPSEVWPEDAVVSIPQHVLAADACVDSPAEGGE
jgi:hypothetical protein